jgi:hypothetical protein
VIPAIPRHILKTTATYKPAGAEDDYGNAAPGTAVTLGNVYIRPTRNIMATSLGDNKYYNMVLYFDAKNSTPTGQVFNAEDYIEFDGVTYNVRKAEPLYDPTTGKLHHWEVQLYGA